MMGVATVALLIAGAIAAVIGQGIVGQQVRTEMIRQATAIENLLGERIQEDPDAARLLVSVLEGERGSDPTANAARARSLIQLVGSARRLFGSPLVDLAFADADGTVTFLTPGTDAALSGRIDRSRVFAGEPHFVTLPSDEVQGDLPFVIHVRPVAVEGLEGSPIRMAVVVARQSAFIEVGQVLRGMAIALAVATFLSVITSRLLAGRITRRLDGLADAATALAGGDVSARAPEEGDDEVTGVAKSFNAMAGDLEELAVREREFLMSVGHDLRTPLTTIAGYAEVLEEGGLDDAETARIAGVLATETSRLRRLVEDLMLLARLEAREFTLEAEHVDVSEHVREVTEGFRPRADEARVRLTADIEQTGLTLTDPDRIGQVLANLIENALRYSPEAGRVTVRVRRIGEEVEIAVADTGSGIDEADLSRVFEKFYVARHYRRVRPEGSGLGLSIVQQLVDALGGRVVVTSRIGQGTTVWVRLPSETSA